MIASSKLERILRVSYKHENLEKRPLIPGQDAGNFHMDDLYPPVIGANMRR